VKEQTIQMLITARALLEQAERYISLGDRYLATAGLIVLQDAVELVFLAVLIECGVDDHRAVEAMSFDEMIAAIGRLEIKVPKSGTLKAMNKLRVTAKHYGQIMEPLTVQSHLNAARAAIDAILLKAIDKPLREIFLTELLGSTTSRPHLDEAMSMLDAGKYFESLVATRKAFFLEFERDYCIYSHSTGSHNPSSGGLLGLLVGGLKASYWTRDKHWINENVKTPFDYIQINYETWRLDAMEWGINTQTLNNIRRLTPETIQLEWSGKWFLRVPAGYAANNATRENAALCLDLTIEVIRRKYDHKRAARTQSTDKKYDTPPAYIGQPLFDKPTKESAVLHVLAENDRYEVEEILNGFDPETFFYRITCTADPNGQIHGYVEKIDEQALSEPDSAIAN